MPNPQIQNDPIYSLPYLYISGLDVSVASDEIIAIGPGQARDSTDNIDMPVGFPNLLGNTYPAIQNLNYQAPLLLDSTVNGANGLDQGALAASSQYAVWLIGDSRNYNQVAGLLSLTSNAYPLLPSGYDSMRLLGFVATDGSTDFDPATLLSITDYKSSYLQPGVSVLGAGNATSFTAIDLSAAIPTTTDQNVIAYLFITYIPAAVGNTLQIRPTGSSATTNLVTITGQAAGIAQQQYLQVVCGVGGGLPEIDYKVSSASDAATILVVGYSSIP